MNKSELVRCDPCPRLGKGDVLTLLVVRADEIQRGDYFMGEYEWEPVLMVGGEKVGMHFVYLYFGRERIGYEYWDCAKLNPWRLVTIARPN